MAWQPRPSIRGDDGNFLPAVDRDRPAARPPAMRPPSQVSPHIHPTINRPTETAAGRRRTNSVRLESRDTLG